MQFSSVISKPLIMTEEAAKDFMNRRKVGEYQLLDVRTHEEYVDEHLPGAQLIPLNELTEGQGKLDSDKPTIVYCRSGGRSQAAAQWLVGQGFREVYDISYHIREWLGFQAIGEYDVDLNLIVPDVDYDGIWGLAFAMEEGLQQLYLKLEAAEKNPDLKKIYHKLAGFEDYHKDRLLKNYQKQTGRPANAEELTQPFRNAMEGGEIGRKSPHSLTSQVSSPLDVFGISMAIEAQSQDLYTRLSRVAENEDARLLLEDMADEEKQHLDYITKAMKKHIHAA